MGPKKPATSVIISEAEKLVNSFYLKLNDPSHFEDWMQKRGVYVEVVVVVPLTVSDAIQAGIALQIVASETNREIFQTHGEKDDAIVYFVAKSASILVELIYKFDREEMAVSEVMTS